MYQHRCPVRSAANTAQAFTTVKYRDENLFTAMDTVQLSQQWAAKLADKEQEIGDLKKQILELKQENENLNVQLKEWQNYGSGWKKQHKALQSAVEKALYTEGVVGVAVKQRQQRAGSAPPAEIRPTSSRIPSPAPIRPTSSRIPTPAEIRPTSSRIPSPAPSPVRPTSVSAALNANIEARHEREQIYRAITARVRASLENRVEDERFLNRIHAAMGIDSSERRRP